MDVAGRREGHDGEPSSDDEIPAADRTRYRWAEWLVIGVTVAAALLGAAVAAGADAPAWSRMGSTLVPVHMSSFGLPSFGEGERWASANAPSVARDVSILSATVDERDRGDPGPQIGIVWGPSPGAGTFDDWWRGSIGPTQLLVEETAPREVSEGPAFTSSISADGLTVAFDSAATDLLAAAPAIGCPAPGCRDVFVHSCASDPNCSVFRNGDLRRLSPGSAVVSDDHTPSLAAEAPAVAFTSVGEPHADGDDDDGHLGDVYVAEVVDGSIVRELVSVPTTGSAQPGGDATNTTNAVSDDGRIVVFTSTDPLVAEDVDDDADVYRRDRSAGVTTLVSSPVTGSATGGSRDAVVSGDGRWVAFTPDAALVGDDGNGVADLYVADAETGDLWRASVAPGGVEAEAASGEPVLDQHGELLAFTTSSALLLDRTWGPDGPPGGPSASQVVVAHLDHGVPVELLAPHRTVGAPASATSRQPDLGGPSGPSAGVVAFTSPDDLTGSSPADGDDLWVAAVPPRDCDPDRFTDVLPGPFCSEVGHAASAGIVVGFDDATFGPLLPVSRQAMAAMLYRDAGSPFGPSPACGVDPFLDVDVGSPFCGEIAWLEAQGWTTGHPDGTFRPTDEITRGALVAMLHRRAGAPELAACPPSAFPDVEATSPFCDAVAWSSATGLVSGHGDGTFRPRAVVTRRVAAALVGGTPG